MLLSSGRLPGPVGLASPGVWTVMSSRSRVLRGLRLSCWVGTECGRRAGGDVSPWPTCLGSPRSLNVNVRCCEECVCLCVTSVWCQTLTQKLCPELCMGVCVCV